jgi:hypothetical protein
LSAALDPRKLMSSEVGMNVSQADIEVTGRSGGTVALVEVKNLPRMNTALAVEVRRAVLEHASA